MKLVAAFVALIAFSAPARSACPSPPPPVLDLDLTRFYADKAGSVVDPEKMAAHKAETAPLTEFVGFIAKQSDRAWTQRSAPTVPVACAVSWLKAWAAADAYLGQMSSPQSQSQRKWDLAGTALAYLKIRRWTPAEDRALIEPWLIKWADAARAVFDDKSIKRNNHWYWLGLGLGAVGLATGSDTHWQMAKAIMADAARDIAADGTLPHELERQGRALHYHAFSVMPLVTLAELGVSRGEDWYALNGGALHRLVSKTAEGLAEPAIFDKLAGATQERPVKTFAGWLSLYRARFPGRLKTDLDQPSSHRWFGGDVSVLRRALAKVSE